MSDELSATPESAPAEPPPPAPPEARRPRWRKVALWGAGLLIAFALLVAFGLPPLLKSMLSKKLTELLHRETTIQEIRLNPFALTLQINGFLIKDRQSSEPFIGFDELFVNLEGMSLIRLGPVVSEIRLKGPHVSVTRREDLTYNFTDLVEEFTARPATPPPSPKPDAEPLRFSLNNIQLSEGRIDFHDRPKHTDHAIRDLTIIIPFLSNLPASTKIFTTPEFRAMVNGTPVALKGQTKPFHDSLETELNVEIDKFEIPKYLEYVPGKLTFKLPSATLSSRLKVAFTQFKEKAPALTVAGTVALNDLAITSLNEEPIFSLPLLDITIEVVDVFGRSAHVKSVLIKQPELRVARERNGAISVARLGLEPPSESVPAEPPRETPAPPTAPADKKPEAPFKVLVDRLSLESATLAFTDRTTDPAFNATISPLTLTVSHFTNEPGKPTGLDLSLTTDAGETITHQGEFTVEPLSARGTVAVTQVPIKRYAPYYDKALRMTVEDGRLDLSTQYAYAKSPAATTLTDASLVLSGMRLRRKGEKTDFFTLPEFTVKETSVDLESRKVVIGSVTTSRASLLVERAKDGTLNVSKLAAQPGPSATASPAAAPPPPPGPNTPAQPWLVELTKLSIDQYAVRLLDQAPADPVTLSLAPIALTVANFSTAKDNNSALTLKLGLNKSGSVAVTGSAGLDPLSATVKVNAQGLDLVPLQPYFSEQVNVVVTSGTASAQGTVTLATPKPGESVLGYTGELGLAKFATLDKANSEDLLRVSNFAVSGIRLTTSPFVLDIKSVTLADLAAHLRVNADKSFNVSHVVVTPPAAAEKPAEEPKPAATPAESKSIRIEALTLTNGAIQFTDRSVKPAFSTTLGEVQASLTHLSSDASQPADVDVKAKLDGAAPLAITGKLNPLSQDLFVDLKVDFREMELSPLTPYAGKYGGYAIQKGKLSLDLGYLINQRKLESANKVLIDQLTFGDTVDSPDATSLPVKLAVSLLQDRKGQIKLDLPVTGSLDDPKFSVWGVVLDIVVNLLTKAATAPFALLGSLLPGGGEELNLVEFDYGTAVLDAAAGKRLTSLGTVLADRPSLNVEVTGRVDTQKDREGLRKALFERKLKTQKVKDLIKRGESAASVEDITIGPDEYLTYLTKTYKEEDIPNKPTNFLGITKSLPQNEMEQLLLDTIAPSDDDLRRLAAQRAQAVRDFLTKTGQIESQRIFLLDTGAASPNKPGEKPVTGKLSRVDLAIK